jgi:indolepyruvate decarboxylase
VQTTIGDYLLQRLSELGVRHMFGVAGDFNLWFLEQAAKSEVKFVGCCNELNAAFAADGCARLAGIAALATTYGVGELAALSGVAGAYAERVPLVCITGSPPLKAVRERALLHHSMADGNFDHMFACFREFTVAQARIEPLHAREQIDGALRTCWLEKRPVYLQLPSDVAGQSTAGIIAPLDLDPPISDPQQLASAVTQIAERLSRANRAAFLLDADADRFGLTDLIVQLAEANAIPIASLIPAKGIVDETHPLSLGLYRGAGSSPDVKDAIEKSDCLICVGTRFTDAATGLFSHTLNFASMVDLQPFDVTIGDRTFAGIQSKDVLAGLLASSPHRSAKPLTASGASSNPTSSGSNQTLTQASFWQRVQHFLRPNDVIIADTGTALFGCAALRLPKGSSFIAQPLWASIGYALPATLGTSLAAQHRRHLLFIGDGAFQVTAQELSTILRLGLNPIIFLINNDGYTIERLIFGPDSEYNNINPWRYAQAPAFFDIHDRAVSYVSRTEDELEAALSAAQGAEGPVFIEVLMSRMDAPGQLARFARLSAEFDFPQLRGEHAT